MEVSIVYILIFLHHLYSLVHSVPTIARLAVSSTTRWHLESLSISVKKIDLRLLPQFDGDGQGGVNREKFAPYFCSSTHRFPSFWHSLAIQYDLPCRPRCSHLIASCPIPHLKVNDRQLTAHSGANQQPVRYCCKQDWSSSSSTTVSASVIHAISNGHNTSLDFSVCYTLASTLDPVPVSSVCTTDSDDNALDFIPMLMISDLACSDRPSRGSLF